MTLHDIQDQLPQGAQISNGPARNAVGVIDDGLVNEGNVLQRQAMRAAELRSQYAMPNTLNTVLTPEIMNEVQRFEGINPMAMGSQTLQGLATGEITRDQQFVGNNSQFTGYYLEPAAKYVIPQYTPLRNMLPRLPGHGIDTINWRAITDYFNGTGPTVTNAAIAQGAGSVQNKLQYVWVNASNVFKMMTVSDVVTFESEIYGRSFEGDVRATVAAKLIPALMQEEELWLIASSQKLWAPPPAYNAVVTNSGGNLVAQTNWIAVTAVNANGETLAYPNSTSPTNFLSFVTTGGSSSATFNINRVPGATSYNIYAGSGGSAPATSAMWKQTTAVSSTTDAGGFGQGYLTITAGGSAAFATSGTALSTLTTNTAINVTSGGGGTPANLPLSFDGIQSLTYLNAGSASTAGVQGETPIVKSVSASNGSLALSDVDGLLEAMYLNAHADPECLFVSVKDHKKLSYLVAQGTNFRINTSNTAQDIGNIIGGQRVTKYINQTTGRLMEVVMLPYLMQGTIIAASLTLPFPVASISRPPLRVEYNREMWAVEYPPDQSHPTEWAYSAYTNESLINQYLGGTSLLTGISLT